MYKSLLPGFTAAVLLATAAAAHVTLEVAQANPSSTYKAVLRVGHGCDGQPTIRLRIQIPEGVVAVKPMPKPGWTLDLVKGPYATSYTVFGEALNEGVKEIVWSGSLPDEFYDEFVFQARITEAFKPGSTVYFPTTQECASTVERWVEIPADGQDTHALKSPAPGLRIIAATATAPMTPSAFTVGSITVEAPWSRATPGGVKIGVGYMRIVNHGAEPDRLVAGTVAVASRFELHESSDVGGVASMRPVEGGLIIPAGGSVELKPGGFHAMLVDLKQPLKEGDVIRGTLVFEKAGTVAIEYTVGGIGAQSAAAEHQHHH
jgi:uncharacterized protein YcnI/copper(I)-binding protein